MTKVDGDTWRSTGTYGDPRGPTRTDKAHLPLRGGKHFIPSLEPTRISWSASTV